MSELGIEYKDADWPHGLRCRKCRHLFQEPERYSEQLDKFVNDIPLVGILCLDCALKGTPDATE